MPDPITDMTEAKWDALKKGAKIPNTPLFKALMGGASSVGSAISSFAKAQKEWTSMPGAKSIDKYLAALMKLEGALTKFSGSKEFSTPEAKSLKSAIVGWQAELKGIKAQVVKAKTKLSGKLATNDVKIQDEIIKEFGF